MNLDEDTVMGNVESGVVPSLETNGDRRLANDPAISLTEPTRVMELEDSDTDPPLRSSLALIRPQQNGQSDDESSFSTVNSGPSSTQTQFVGVVIPKPVTMALPHASSRTGVVYDPRMRFHTEKDTEEDEDIHPEDPRRIYEIFMALKDAGLLEDENEKEEDQLVPFKLWRIPARFAEPAEICLVHSREHYRFMESLQYLSDAELSEMGRKLDSLYLHNLTLFCARLSAGGAIEACRAVVAGHVKNSFAIIRPPGHHAEHNDPGGFCFFDNVAIAAKICQKDFGEKCRKILILDWDVHHGNGVQQAFENDPNVLYISLHVYADGSFYPSKTYGDHLHVGLESGVGKNINIPWPCQGMKDGDYMYAFQKIVMPCAMEFDPDLVIISAGFDAAEGDLLGGCHVSPGGFAHMTSQLMTLAGGKVVACLEGGYNLKSIARSALAVVRTLMGEAPERLQDVGVSSSGVETVRLVERTHSPYWNCLFPKDKAKGRLTMGGHRLSDVLRYYQSSSWQERFQMSELHIHRDRLSKSFENQVLATSNWMEARPLLVIFHDPPETIGEQNAYTGTFDAHNIIITDVAEQYIEAATNNGFSVIDVNIPKHTTEAKDDHGYVQADKEEQRKADNHELATYLWDNYLEINDATHIFFLGVGAAHADMIWILGQQPNINNRVDWIFNFVSETAVHPVNRPTDDFPEWYFRHSNVYVANDHLCWAPEKTRRVRRKHGRLERSEFNDINEILLENKDTVMQKIIDLTSDWRKAEVKLEAKRKRDTAAAVARESHMNNMRSEYEHNRTPQINPFNQGGPSSYGMPYAPSGHTTPNEMPMRGSPSASPNSAAGALRSPAKVPPKGWFNATTTSPGGSVIGPQRSPDRMNGPRSPGAMASPSRRGL